MRVASNCLLGESLRQLRTDLTVASAVAKHRRHEGGLVTRITSESWVVRTHRVSLDGVFVISELLAHFRKPHIKMRIGSTQLDGLIETLRCLLKLIQLTICISPND